MKFKHTFLALMAIAAVGMTSCSDENAPEIPSNNSESNAVTFTTYTSNALSRTAVLDNDGLKAGGFGVFGLQYKADESISSNGWNYNFFANQEVSWDVSLNTWAYSPVKYWPADKTDKMTVVAYAPYQDLFNSDEKDVISLASDPRGGQPILTYTVPAIVKDGVDLVYDNTKKDFTKPEDNRAIDFNFKHALARMGFSILKSSDLKGEIILEKMTLTSSSEKPIFTKADFNLYTGDWELTDEGISPNATWTWTEDNFKTTAVSSNVYNNLKDDSYLMVIPSEIETSFSVEIEYTIIQEDPNVPEGIIEIHNKAISASTFTPQMGKAYSWRFYITGDEVKFDSSVSDWTHN